MNRLYSLAIVVITISFSTISYSNHKLDHTVSNATCERIMDLEADVLAFFGLTKSSPQVGLNAKNHVIKLDLENANITELPDDIGNLIFLEELWLGSNKINTLPESIGNLTNLNFLYLYNNQIETLPESIGWLSNLEQLRLGSNKITKLPNSISRLKKLAILAIEDNKLTELPESIETMSYLKEIWLKGNSISSKRKQELKNILTNLITVT